MDPSHLIWQQMDPVAVIAALGSAVHHVHLKDTAFVPSELAVAGVLDTRSFDRPGGPGLELPDGRPGSRRGLVDRVPRCARRGRLRRSAQHRAQGPGRGPDRRRPGVGCVRPRAPRVALTVSLLRASVGADSRSAAIAATSEAAGPGRQEKRAQRARPVRPIPPNSKAGAPVAPRPGMERRIPPAAQLVAIVRGDRRRQGASATAASWAARGARRGPRRGGPRRPPTADPAHVTTRPAQIQADEHQARRPRRRVSADRRPGGRVPRRGAVGTRAEQCRPDRRRIGRPRHDRTARSAMARPIELGCESGTRRPSGRPWRG